jgi:glutamate-1-semialdehyde 2,1-aminomutase
VYQAGTLSGNPLAVTAGLVTLSQLTPGVYDHLERLGQQLQTGLDSLMRTAQVPGCVQRVGSMITVFFGPAAVRSWDDAAGCDTARFGRFHQGLTRRGIYWPPAQFEAAFISNAHTEADIVTTLEAAKAAFAEQA